jgi:6-phosphogluconolactonase (cycloisomerase 2 family)
VAPNGRWLLATSVAGKSVTVLGINSTTGALTSINTVTLAGTPNAVAVDASNRYAFVTSSSDNALSTLQLDGTSGQLSFAGSVSAGNTPQAVVVAPGP